MGYMGDWLGTWEAAWFEAPQGTYVTKQNMFMVIFV